MIHRLEELDPAGIEARLAAKPALVLPLGTIEWHSRHLPLGLDLLKAAAIAERTADRAEAVLAPAAWWAAGGVPFPFTLHLSGALFEPLFAAVLDGLAEMGFRAICLLNGHYGLENSIAVRRAALACKGATVIPIADYELLTDLGGDRRPRGRGWETSLLWPVRPDLIDLDVEGDLPGVIGADRRGRASVELGEQGLELASARAAALLDRGARRAARTARCCAPGRRRGARAALGASQGASARPGAARPDARLDAPPGVVSGR